MERITNPVRDVLASIRFAVLILLLLAVTSIIATLIPQGEPVAFYIDKYGQQLAILIKIFDLDCTYSSIWFGFLLFLLTLSLTACFMGDRLKRRFNQTPGDHNEVYENYSTRCRLVDHGDGDI